MINRFVFDPSIYHFTDTKTGKTYCEYNLDKVVDLLNDYEEGKRNLQEVNGILNATADNLMDENNHLKELHEYDEEYIKDINHVLKEYRKIMSCNNCKYHNYDWDIDDGYGGDEYEVCDKGNHDSLGMRFCKDWEEL